MEYILDSVGNADGVTNFGTFMNIVNLVFPTSVEPNTPFTISFDAQNGGVNALNAFGYIFDFGTQNQVPGSYWEAAVAAGGTHPVSLNFAGITSTFSGEVRVGHVEGGTTGCTNPVGSEGGFVCGNPSFPNTPTTGHRYQCQDGAWVDLGVDQTNCPTGGGGGINPLYLIGIIAAVGVVGVVFLVGKR
jgi:hypothetical protein